ncbi:MAG: hemolysin family protein [Pseudomonadota bacterium]|jgi:magnesium and cobalt transporter|nr:hemolysin family protein [Pseudomonadota bacterium]MEC7245427.1 hemolysin family protein [Pseudomonadota bacterium]
MFNELTLSRKWPFIGKQTSVREELTGLIETSIRQTDTEFDNQEGLLLRNMLGLRDITAEDVMVPRADIVAIDISEGFEAAFRQISAAAHSRVPAYEGNQDNVRGMLHIKDLVAHSLSPEQPVLRDLLRPVLFVSPAIRLLDLLQEMRLKRQHLALVIDEFGGVDGLITIEDLVEEIVGEIEDEHDDTDAPQFEIINEDIAVADARLEMEELEAHIGITLECDERDEIDTLGGFIFALAGHVPVRGEVLHHSSGLEFEVLDSDPRKLRLVRIRGLKSLSLDRPTIDEKTGK